MSRFISRALTLTVLAVTATAAHAHVILFMDPVTRNPAKAVQLINIDVAQEPTGFLTGPGDVQYFTFDATSGQTLDIQAAVVKKRGQTTLNHTVVIYGPGLPAVPADAKLPFMVPQGSGALILDPTDTREDFQDQPYDHFLVGPEMKLTMPGGTYMGAVFDRAGRTGEYKVSIGVTHSGAEFTKFQLDHPDPFLGDVNGDEKVDIADASLALQFAVGLKVPTARQLHNADVAPPGDKSFVPGDNKVDIQDVLRLLRRAVGLDNDAMWP